MDPQTLGTLRSLGMGTWLTSRNTLLPRGNPTKFGRCIGQTVSAYVREQKFGLWARCLETGTWVTPIETCISPTAISLPNLVILGSNRTTHRQTEG